MGLTSAAETRKAGTPEELRGLPEQPEYEQSEIRSAISDAADVEKYVAKALKALKDEDYESVKGYLQDIETSSASAAATITKMEEGLERFEEWGYAWKQEAMSQPTEVIEHLEKDWKSCLNQVTEVQAEEGITAKLADAKSRVVINSWGIKDQELAAAILAVSKVRGEELRQNRKGHQPVVAVETKIRKITGEQRRSFF